MEFNKEFGTLIRSIRGQKGFTQEVLAKKIKISRTALTNIEAGRQACTLDNALELAHCLNIEISKIQDMYFNYFFRSKLSVFPDDIKNEVSQHLGIG